MDRGIDLVLFTIFCLASGKLTTQDVQFLGLMNLLDDANDLGRFDRPHHWHLGGLMLGWPDKFLAIKRDGALLTSSRNRATKFGRKKFDKFLAGQPERK